MLSTRKLSALLALAIAIAVAILKEWSVILSSLSSVRITRRVDVLVENTSRLPPLSYRPDSSIAFDTSYSHLARKSWSDVLKQSPDTTAVVLNWSRFHNVQRIASLLCSPDLDHVIKEVFIWNNNPTQISYNVRVITCRPSKFSNGLSDDEIWLFRTSAIRHAPKANCEYTTHPRTLTSTAAFSPAN